VKVEEMLLQACCSQHVERLSRSTLNASGMLQAACCMAADTLLVVALPQPALLTAQATATTLLLEQPYVSCFKPHIVC
jgi:hypothetical protein